MDATRRLLPLVCAALLLASPPVAAGVSYRGTWTGDTSQNQEITFKVNRNNKVHYLKLGWEASGGGCSVTSTTTMPDILKRIRDDRFRVSTTGNPALTVRGLFETRRRAEGTFHVEYSPGGGCPVLIADGDWTARKQ